MKNRDRFRTYLEQQNISFTFRRIFVDGLGGMAHGLFASLLIGCIIGTLADFINIPVRIGGETVNFLAQCKTYAYAVQGPAMAAAIACAMKAPPFVLYSCLTVGYAANALGGGGGPLAVFAVTALAQLCGKLVSRRTPIDIIVTPAVTIFTGVLTAIVLAPPIGKLATLLGNLIMAATEMRPFLMGIVCSVIMGVILTLPISSAAICSAFGLVGLAGGACAAGCCAHMVGYAVASYRDNKLGGLLSQGLGTSMLQVPNLMKKPVLWLIGIVPSVITGPLATCVFRLQMNGAPISSGMGTSGLVGPIGIITGWFHPSQQALDAVGGGMAVDVAAAYAEPVMAWLGLALICVVLPAILAWVTAAVLRKLGLLRDGDLRIDC